MAKRTTMSPSLHCVLTTIQRPTACVRRLAAALAPLGAPLLVVGDRKGPDTFKLPGSEFYALDAQRGLPFRLASALPAGHYARKNLGYLLAIHRGATCIYETDDDNAPNDRWRPRARDVQAQPVAARRWMNVYRAYSDEVIWPRGFPLELVGDPATFNHDPSAPARCVTAPIQQGLADLSPDVDAVWRMLMDRDFRFRHGPSLHLPPGTWCPFNSQTTWWWPEAYPLMYLPSHCSFRMTDVWRSFVAQRCLWELGQGLVFHPPEVVQQRNPHDLLRDFADEVPGYLNNARITARLERLALRPGAGAIADNLLLCYRELVLAGFVPAAELPLVESWTEDLAGLARSRAA
jgi:hypothetical protein